MSEQTEADRFAGAWVAGHQGVAALADLVLHAPDEVLESRGHPERLDRNIGGEGIPFETMKGEQFVSHDSSLGR